MRLLGLGIGALVVLAGAMCIVTPGVPLSLGHWVVTPVGLNVVAALRIVLGLLLVLAAPSSRAPMVLRVVGALVMLAGLATPWFGVERSRAVLDWASAEPVIMRLIGCLVVLIGGFLVYAFRPVGARR